jgi:hypothetical protein
MRALSSLNHQHVLALKSGIAFGGILLLLWYWRDVTRGRPEANRLRDAGLAILGILAAAGWWNFGGIGLGTFIHHHEFFHYYLGAKYSAELGYTNLYDCVAAAEVQQGRGRDVASRWIRDLRTNELRAGSPAVENPALCRDRFGSIERWNEFKHDVEWFRARIGPENWILAQMDHGYNATPVWTLAGRALANTGPVSDSRVFALAAIDPVLIAAMWGLVSWAFGWRVLAVALIWWGTNYPARYNYIGGAFLRQDWLFLAVAALCFAKRGRAAAAGFALSWSALLRIFPAFIVLGLLLKIAVDSIAAKRAVISSAYWRFAAGAVLALAILLPLSFTIRDAAGAGPLSGWRAFRDNSEKLLSTPLTNHMGLPVVMAFQPAGRSERLLNFWVDAPWDAWKEARRQTFQDRRWLFVAIVCGFLALLARAVRDGESWIALSLGIGTIPFLTELTCYYYGILLGFAFLWPRSHWAGIGLLVLSLMSNLVLTVLPADDDRFTAISLFVLVYVTCITVTFALSRRDQPAPARHQELVGTRVE